MGCSFCVGVLRADIGVGPPAICKGHEDDRRVFLSQSVHIGCPYQAEIVGVLEEVADAPDRDVDGAAFGRTAMHIGMKAVANGLWVVVRTGKGDQHWQRFAQCRLVGNENLLTAGKTTGIDLLAAE